MSCDSATPCTLADGQLLQNQTAIGKHQNEIVVELGALLRNDAGPVVDTGFAFIDGVPVSQAPEVPLAISNSCEGAIYVSFDPSDPGNTLAPYSDCSQVSFGDLSSAPLVSTLPLSTSLAFSSSSTSLLSVTLPSFLRI